MLSAAGLPNSVVFVGGSAAAMLPLTLRQEGYAGPIKLLSADAVGRDRHSLEAELAFEEKIGA